MTQVRLHLLAALFDLVFHTFCLLWRLEIRATSNHFQLAILFQLLQVLHQHYARNQNTLQFKNQCKRLTLN
jgi:hypothetical protein